MPEGRGGKEVHRVQILDPATGTGTFLAEVVKHIYQKFKGQQGIWSNYVNQHLIPRLNGFELLMASYAMAHLKMDMLLTETGYKATSDQRFRIFLTNSLEEAHPDSGTLFSSWLSDEAEQANAVKRDTTVMVIMGNPPYSVSSTNKSKWIEKLVADYKKDLNERNIQPLSDDYIKFIRFGQHFIDKNGSGILAFISNNSFLDGIIHKQMRKHLLSSFDKIYVLDLHGNSKKKETALDGSIDQNVFDIMQGVSINIFIKSERINLKSEILHYDVYGKRDNKYDFLNNNCLKSISWKNLEYQMPDYFFVKKDFHSNNEYLNFVKLDKLFNKYSAGIQTKRDALFVDDNSTDLENRIVKLLNKTYDSNFITKYNINDSSSYKLTSKIKELSFSKMLICKIHYRPFDDKYIYYDSNLIGRAFYTTMSHLNKPSNLGLIVSKQFNDEFKYVMISNKICDMNLISNAGSFGAGFSFPLCLYPETNTQLSIGGSQKTTPPVGHPSAGGECRTPNLNAEIVQKIAQKLNLTFVPEKNSSINSPTSDERQQDTLYSPPLEGCPQGGVVNIPPTQGGEINIPTTQTVEANNPPPTTIVATIHNTPIIRNFVENLPHNPKLNQLAKDKRKAGILSEVLFWQQVHKGKFHNLDFDRQRIIGNYIVDFYVKTLGLIIEIDGNSHDNKQEYDAARQIYLENHGLKLYRILDWDIKQSLTGVMIALEDYIIKEFGEKMVLNSESGKVVIETTPPVGHPSKGGELNGELAPTDILEGGELNGELAPIDLLDYIYAVLHSPAYREKYKEFLKIDFPRVPYPTDATTFWQLVKLGGEIRQIHLLESPETENYVTQYPIEGDNIVIKPRFENSPPVLERQLGTLNSPSLEERQQVTLNSPPVEGCPQGGVVYINDTQYFANVPLTAWEFYIGGYQPAQKWLKDRNGRSLQFEDILHYQKIIVALKRTAELMVEIDGVLEV